MRRVLLIEDHPALQLAILRSVLAGGAAMLLRELLGLSPALGCWLAALLLGAALAPPRGMRHAAWLLLCALVAGVATQALSSGCACPTTEALALAGAVGLASLGGLPIGDGRPRWLGAIVLFTTAGLTLAARLVPLAVQAQDLALPGQLSVLLGGAGMGLIVGSAALVRGLRLRKDPVDPELLGLLPAQQAQGEVSGLVRQALAAYRDATEALNESSGAGGLAARTAAEARAAAEDLVKKIARFGKRWGEIDEQARRSDRAGLEARHRDLTERQAATQDEQVRAEYGKAIAALDQQLQYLRDIDRERERAVARLHHQVATLERLRLAALRHRTVDAARLSDELKAVADELSRTGQDLDHAAEALSELPL